ncbi:MULTISPECIES: DNA repair protein RecO [Flammeovirga]|uniref:DNA repair protein RecO n=1 Tax=Flammeovirga agarivorans TaxID=2726742 RepID=A0A7X8SN21_9BACT|nr:MULTISPECIES: DNA repair protein RecO [Flammeovirga]NLR93238.1 DNA repair protein RecO [Flammeovirga agarivorans]
MIASTKGIVLSNMRYQESSLIVHIYTKEFGRRDYIIKGAYSKRSNKASFYHPLNILDLQVYERPNMNLQMVKEVRIDQALLSFQIQPQKSMILTFLSELLEKVLRSDEVGSDELYEFLRYSLVSLDKMSSNWNCFTLQFMLRLSHHLGIGIYSAEMLLIETEVSAHVDEVLKGQIDQLIKLDYHEAPVLPLVTRREIMDKLVKFYSMQLQNFGELKTLEVLRNIGNSLKRN